jgi:integrative and conjugative element protein (TIGR02256 family)
VRNSWVLIAYPVIAMFEQEQARCAAKVEAGGILIGSYRGPHVEITDFTRPAKSDIRQPYCFVKQDPKHQRAATRAWVTSGGKDTYVGEWHTHPVGDPKPSPIDIATWRDLTDATKRAMIFAIVTPHGWALFHARRRLLWSTASRLTRIENGHSGLVFRVR